MVTFFDELSEIENCDQKWPPCQVWFPFKKISYKCSLLLCRLVKLACEKVHDVELGGITHGYDQHRQDADESRGKDARQQLRP